ncbi:MAG: aldo/keto reductase [Spirochaetaceae bacterium]|nr:MAG: aldo/keto reductase [Spirochaetaceae bacterium]
MSITYPLGQSSIAVTPIGLGCWQFSRSRGLAGSFWPAIPQATVREIVRVSMDGGINWFDTAEAYGGGASEESLAEALSDLAVERSRFVVADKWFPAFRMAGSIRRTFDARQRALRRIALPGVPTIDLHQIHQPFSFSSVERQVAEMSRLVNAGSVRAVGVSNFNEKLMRRAHARLASDGIPLASNQMRYSLLDREIERNGVLEAAAELGVTIIAYSPLAQGILTGKFHGEQDIRGRHGPRKWLKRFKPAGLAATRPLIDELDAVAKAHLSTPAQVALAWVVQRHGTRVVAIPGATSVNQAQSNANALALNLSQRELQRLDLAGRDAERRLKQLQRAAPDRA